MDTPRGYPGLAYHILDKISPIFEIGAEDHMLTLSVPSELFQTEMDSKGRKKDWLWSLGHMAEVALNLNLHPLLAWVALGQAELKTLLQCLADICHRPS